MSLRMYLTKKSISDLNPGMVPVIGSDGRRIGETPNPEAKPYFIFDLDTTSPPGFGLYVGRTKRTFIIQVRAQGTVRRYTIGELGPLTLSSSNPEVDARTKATQMRVNLKSGKPVLQARRTESAISEMTLGKILALYGEEYAKRDNKKLNSLLAMRAAWKRLAAVTKIQVKNGETTKIVKVDWLNMSVRSIGKETVDQIWDEIAVRQGHRTAAEQTLMWCRAAFNSYLDSIVHDGNLLGREDVRLVNPFLAAKSKIRKRQTLEKEYEEKGVRNPISNTPSRLGVFLNEVWARREIRRQSVDYIIATLLLGARRNETAPLKWYDLLTPAERRTASYVDVNKRTVLFKNTKNGNDHELPMGRFLSMLMWQRWNERDSANPYVFPRLSQNPNKKSEHYNSPKEFVHSLRTALDASLKKEAFDASMTKWEATTHAEKCSESRHESLSRCQEQFEREYERFHFTMHDLRRTFCTEAMLMNDFPYAIVRRLMNHGTLADVTGRYGKVTVEDLRPYMQRLEDELLRHAATLPKSDI